MTETRDLFDAARYPTLRRVCYSDRYGRMELVSVSETSDGFLMGTAVIGDPDGDDRYMHSIFIGCASDFRRRGLIPCSCPGPSI